MFFAQFKSVFRSLRFRLMLLNAVVMLVASFAVLWGLREGVRYTLLDELDDDLRDDFGEVSLALVNVFEADSRRLHAQMDRKARGHVQRSWFVQLVDMRSPRERHEERLRFERFRQRFQDGDDGDESSLSKDRQIPRENLNSDEFSTEELAIAELLIEELAVNTRESLGGTIASASRAAEQKPGSASSPNPSPRNVVRAERTARASTVIENESGTSSNLADGDSSPRIIWQTFNVPDWSMLTVPSDFHLFVLPDGVATTIDDYRVLEQTVHNAKRGPVRVRIGASMRSIHHASATTDRLMLINVFIALVIAPLGGYCLALRATLPLKAMIRTADRLRPQQMEERLPIRHTEDEIDQLSVAFNRLLDRIAEYLAKRQDLLANSAHELRTPLAALRSTAELALGSERTAEEYRELMESIVSECGNLEQLVNQLLLLSETEQAHFDSRGEIVDFSRITNEACDMFGAVAESRGVSLNIEIMDGVMVDGSRMHLRQLLNNLIDNAIKFIPGEGQVTVGLQTTPAGQCLKVRDTGIGIAEEEQRRLFERFYRGDRARRRNTPTRGTGLGLSICRAIAEAHGGAISVHSQPGVGTEVSVVLPLPAHPSPERNVSFDKAVG